MESIRLNSKVSLYELDKKLITFILAVTLGIFLGATTTYAIFVGYTHLYTNVIFFLIAVLFSVVNTMINNNYSSKISFYKLCDSILDDVRKENRKAIINKINLKK